jgi:CHAT domain-containing protein
MGSIFFRKSLFKIVFGAALVGLAPGFEIAAHAQDGASTRAIADITAILDNEKPDPKALAKLRADADAKLRAGLGRGELAEFLFARCNARATIGDFQQAIPDCEKSVELARSAFATPDYGHFIQGLALQYGYIGELKKSLDTWLRMAGEVDRQGSRGYMFNVNRNIGQLYIALGDLRQGEAYTRRNNTLLVEAKGWNTYGGFRRASWNGDVERGSANLYEARGQWREAESAYQRCIAWFRERQNYAGEFDRAKVPVDQTLHALDAVIALQGRAKARQGRMAEGEADVRRALLTRLKATGKYNLATSKFIGYLAQLLVEQGRFADAEKLTRTQVDINRTLGVADDTTPNVLVLSQLASILNLEGRWEEAGKTYADIDRATANWPAARREGIVLSTNMIDTLYATNNVKAGLVAAQRLLDRQRAALGEKHLETALARGVLAMGLARDGRAEEAEREFKAAIPILASASHETDVDDAISSAARDQRMAFIIESYIALLAGKGGAEAAAESFRLADLVRGRSVQGAVAASSARAVARNPALADLARKAQDLDKQIAAQLGVLNGVLALPASERDAKALKELQGEIDKLHAARDAAKRELASKFRDYANLVEPQPATVADIRTALKPGEAFVSFYFGRDAGFVWAVSQDGGVGFAPLKLSFADIERKVTDLRASLVAEVDYISDIPAFDVELALDLYNQILKPVEQVWRPAKSLIVATNGALGLLPLSLLPTEARPVNPDPNAPMFARYRDVPWLARTHAVTMIPSASSLRSLRQLPPGSSKREPLIGFGDPVFSKEQATNVQVASADPTAETGATAATRGPTQHRRATLRAVDARFSELQALPDTAEELKAIAAALSTDPDRSLNLGKAANELKVKTTDLTKYRFVVFSTHGLTPGQLGLTQPAIALSAPDVAGVDGDGMLTMEEVLALKLDADWVVLSACNSAAGAAAGAEAVSGLGRAFFYAGTRALLVTNWAVDSASARDLVSGTFHRLAEDNKLTRAEALRQSMVAVMDGPGFVGASGKTEYAYAHPLYWAPYSIVGDGGN